MECKFRKPERYGRGVCMSVNKFDRTELQECQSDRNHCDNCKNGLCPFSPFSALSNEYPESAAVIVQCEMEGYS